MIDNARAAREHVTATLPADLPVPLDWDALMADLYRAAEKTWSVDLIEEQTYWALIWAHREGADNADRAQAVRVLMDDVDWSSQVSVEELRYEHRQRWERRRVTQHRAGLPPIAVAVWGEEETRAATPYLIEIASQGDPDRDLCRDWDDWDELRTVMHVIA